MIEKGKQLTLSQRNIIEQMLNQLKRKFEIANELDKTPSTIAREINRNRILKPYNIYKTYKINEQLQINNEELHIENETLKEENQRLEKENNKLKYYIEKTFEYVSLLFDFSKERLKRLVNNFVYDLDKTKNK